MRGDNSTADAGSESEPSSSSLSSLSSTSNCEYDDAESVSVSVFPIDSVGVRVPVSSDASREDPLRSCGSSVGVSFLACMLFSMLECLVWWGGWCGAWDALPVSVLGCGCGGGGALKL